MKTLDRQTAVQCIALVVLVLLLGTAVYIILQNRAGLSPAEKKRLFFDLTCHNEELRERLRLTKYFSETAAAEEESSAFWADAKQSYNLWRRACTEKSFAEVKQALGGRYQVVPASYYWGR